MLMPTSTVKVVLRTAKKEHRCDCKIGCTIKPGEKYIEESCPPWTMIIDDPDGRPFPIGEWGHMRYHSECFDEMMYR